MHDDDLQSPPDQMPTKGVLGLAALVGAALVSGVLGGMAATANAPERPQDPNEHTKVLACFGQCGDRGALYRLEGRRRAAYRCSCGEVPHGR
jgi:hypothetical protein